MSTKALSKYREDYEELSGLASSSARTAAFAGIAVIWVFRISEGGQNKLPPELLGPTFCFVLALALDLTQYILGTVIWSIFFYNKERGLSATAKEEDSQVTAPECYSAPGWVAFGLKMLSVFVGYAWLGKFIVYAW